ncbi:hypothetical protein C8Q80DRAFT_468143 [Daedaleopsis nitida]|nr:hypothetical protein C8Q80DRAFT_468143 [Daedaleopsis nitida]
MRTQCERLLLPMDVYGTDVRVSHGVRASATSLLLVLCPTAIRRISALGAMLLRKIGALVRMAVP